MAISEEKIARAKELRAILKKRQKETKKLADEYYAIENEYSNDRIARFKTMDLNDAYFHSRLSGNMFDTKGWPERASEGTYIHIIKGHITQGGKLHCIREYFDVDKNLYNEKKIYYGVHTDPLHCLGDVVTIDKDVYERAKAGYMATFETELERLSNKMDDGEDRGVTENRV